MNSDKDNQNNKINRLKVSKSVVPKQKNKKKIQILKHRKKNLNPNLNVAEYVRLCNFHVLLRNTLKSIDSVGYEISFFLLVVGGEINWYLDSLQ